MLKRKSVLKITAVPAILVAGFLVMQGLGSSQKETRKRDVKPEARAVETQQLAFSDLVLRVEGDGLVESEQVLEIVSEANGQVLFAKHNLKDGTYVREGELVVKIDARDVENDLYGMRSDFLNAVAAVLPELRLDDARIYKRWFDYFNAIDINKPIPELPTITNAQEKIKVSTKNIIGKYYEVKNQEILLAKHTIRAPFSGYVTSSGVIENSFVSTGQSLFTLTDPKNLVVSVPLRIDESKNIEFATGPAVTIYVDEDGGDRKEGRILRKETIVERNSQTLQVYVSFSNQDLNPYFLPGGYVSVSIEGKTLEDVALVPRNLLDNDGFVYTLEGGTLGRQQLEVLAYQGDQAIVRNSLAGETVVVTTILQKPLVGMEIRSINMPELNPEPELAADEVEPSEEEMTSASADQVAAGG
jgi:multidrug efflux pump subunit AcrA (membrane-fusion protein)